MNIVFGKIGRSMYFNKSNWGSGAGNNEAPLLFSAIARNNPQNTYYLIGKSDLSRCSDEVYKEWFPHGNVIDCWKEWNVKKDDPTTWISKVLENVKIDFGIIHGGMVSLSIPNKIYCLDRKTGGLTDKLRSPLLSLVNYVSPITWYLNESKIPWMTITSDGRYMPLQARDLINVEKVSYGVRSGEATVKRFVSYEKQDEFVEHKVDLVYGRGEYQYLLDKDINCINKNTFNKDKKLVLFFHQYDDKKRFLFIKSIVSHFNDVEIYGKWKDVEDDPKYKGSLSFDELNREILPRVKYTVCYPITPGDISAKWVEAAYNGIIPFFHESYDKDRLLSNHNGIPSFFWFKTPEQLEEKINYLEENINMYVKARSIFAAAIENEDYYNGKYFNNLIDEFAKKYLH